MVAFGFLPLNFWRSWEPTNGTLSFHDCSVNSKDPQSWWGHLNSTCCNSFALRGGGDAKTFPSHPLAPGHTPSHLVKISLPDILWK